MSKKKNKPKTSKEPIRTLRKIHRKQMDQGGGSLTKREKKLARKHMEA